MDFSQKWFIVVVIVIGIWWLYQLSVEKYLQNDPEILRLKNKLLPFFPEIANTVVLKGDKSYTLGKYKIHLCIEDENGNVYATGLTGSSGWVNGGFDTSYGNNGDGYLVKFDTTGTHQWSSYLGGG